MPLSQRKINDIWQSGFCAKAVRHSATTEDYDSGIRAEWLIAHIQDRSLGGDACAECKRAITLKNLEAKASILAGGNEALNEFHMGRQGYNKQTVKVVILSALKEGIIDRPFIEWMERISVERAGKDFPG